MKGSTYALRVEIKGRMNKGATQKQAQLENILMSRVQGSFT